MRTQITAGAKRPRAEPTQKGAAAIMVLKMLGSAAAVFGGGGGGGGGGHSSSRALVAASASTSALASTRSLFGFRGGVGSGARAASSSAFVGRLPLLAGRKHQHTQMGQQHRRYSSSAQQRRDRGRTCALSALMASSGDPTGGLWGALGSRSSSRQVGKGGGGGPRLMSTPTGAGGEGRGFWTDDEGFEESPSSLRDGRSGSAAGGGYAVGGERPAWEAPPADAAEAGFLQEEEDEAEWMAGQEVDPEAEAIFFGDKVPFTDLGLSPALCGHLEALGIGHSTAVQVWILIVFSSGVVVVVRSCSRSCSWCLS